MGEGEPPLNGPIDMNRLLQVAPPLPRRVPLVALLFPLPLAMPSNPNHLEDIMALSAWKTRAPSPAMSFKMMTVNNRGAAGGVVFQRAFKKPKCSGGLTIN